MISIIIPVYNTAKYLNKCLQSVLCQLYTNWECILVDDGSDDGSHIICDEWSQKDTRFISIHQPNQGVSSARNNGIAHARGEYICFIDSDDWVEIGYLQHLISVSKNSDLVVSGIIRNYGDTQICTSIPVCEGNFEINDAPQLFVEMNRLSLLYGPWVKLFSTKIIKNNNILFPIGCSYGEDLIFNYQYLRYVNTISCVSFADYHYRIIGEISLSGRLRTNQFEEDYGQWKIQRQFYVERGIWTEEAKEFMYVKLWGIVYDGIFLLPKIQEDKVQYLKNILDIQEIKDLQLYSHNFKTAYWIKWCIIHRLWYVFYLTLKFNK